MDKVVSSPGDAGGFEFPDTTSDVNKTMEALIETANVDRVYGEPIEVGDTKIIPTSENLTFMGFGFGSGYGQGMNEEDSEEDDEGTPMVGAGGGGGGGGRTFSRPVAVVIASPEGVRVEPIADRTKVIMAAITAAGFMASMVFRMTRGPQS
jgi:uncharacterized spore protein YtfJ